MIEKKLLLSLHERSLPVGTGKILDLLEKHIMQIDMVDALPLNRPTLTLATHGMILNLSCFSPLTRYSHPIDIYNVLPQFFKTYGRTHNLALYVNCSNFLVSSDVIDCLKEIEKSLEKKEQLQKKIDQALDAKDFPTFQKLTQELLSLENKQPLHQ